MERIWRRKKIFRNNVFPCERLLKYSYFQLLAEPDNSHNCAILASWVIVNDRGRTGPLRADCAIFSQLLSFFVLDFWILG